MRLLKIGLILLILSCNEPDKQVLSSDIYTIRNKNGLAASFTSAGARIMSLEVPDKAGNPVNVVAGFDSVSHYAHSTEPYFGATIGRYANRIAKGKFTLEGKEYKLTINNGPNTLHSGTEGFQSKQWIVAAHNDSSIIFSYHSPDGEGGFPGNLDVQVTYALTSLNELTIDFIAVADTTTVINLTNHAFFNLNGEGSGMISNHLLQINANYYTPVDNHLIPTGAIESVKGTAFDFTLPKVIGKEISYQNDQLVYGNGYDHNYVLNGPDGMRKAAIVTGDKTGIRMEVFTDQPGLQFYSGNFMQSKNKLSKGMDDFRTAFCLETQHFPDSPNQPAFPSTVLKKGENYHSSSIYQFFVK